jgi:hypothetical protein
MITNCPEHGFVSVENAIIFNMWKIAAIVGMLERSCETIEIRKGVAKETVH